MKTDIKLLIVYALTIAIVAGSGVSQAKGTADAKVLFHGPGGVSIVTPETGDTTHKPDANSGGAYSTISNYYEKLKNPALHVWMELKKPGSNYVKRVNDRHVFKSGNEIRIHVTGNTSGRLYVMHHGSTGTQKLLPVSAGGNSISSGDSYVIPSNGGWLKFDNNPGIETVKLVLAPSNETGSSLPEASMQDVLAMYDQFSTSKGLVETVEGGEKDLLVSGGWRNQGMSVTPRSQGGAVQTVQAPSDPGRYVGNTDGEPVTMELKLRHQ